ncbi:transglutaminase family protein [Sandarakinorhabdus sp.]|uniref:transglutaminase family protein n=1 Tax=Sandarakinorhabdus sp. TaxID=1916663 RepID=UPI00286E978E|nr:transglutaminase family protein [Sandarakinorhabdus sp.]
MELNAIGLLDDADIDLVEAGIALSLADRPDADAARLRRLVSGWAVTLNRDTAPPSGGGRALRLAGLIAGDAGLTGATDDYDHPDNADLVAVAARGRGLPVALSILYVALARRVGWRAEALNLPGHVLVEVHGQGEPALIDPFEHGIGITRARARDIARHGSSGDTAAAPFQRMSNRQLLVRLMTNQASRARAASDAARARTLYERMTAVAPRMPALWWERARLEQLAGDNAAARSSLTAMLETTHEPALARRIHAALAALARSNT